MASGAFSLRVGSIANRSAAPGAWWQETIAGPTYSGAEVDIITAIRGANPGIARAIISEDGVPPNAGDTSTGGTGELTFNMDDANIVLTGDVSGTFDISGLPAGFTITAATLTISSDQANGNITRNGFTIGACDPTGLAVNVNLSANLGVLAVILDTYGIDVTTDPGWMPPVTCSFWQCSISGTWETLGFAFSFPQDGDTVAPNDTITITSDGDPLTDLLLDELTVQLIDLHGTETEITPTTQTDTLLVFLVPDLPAGTYILQFTGNGVQFSGTVQAGSLIILLVDGSGLYVLRSGQRHDTYYYDSPNGDTTTNLAIPRPFAKTGFIGG